jgi:peptide chain release factor 3
LQFEVVQYRLQSEYGAESRLESAPWELMRWLAPDVAVDGLDGRLPNGAKLAVDAEGRPVVLFPTEWAIRYFQKQHPDVALSDVPFAAGDAVTRQG